MAHTTYLRRRGAVYYARMPVPENLQLAFGKRELSRSLDTKDLPEAKLRLSPIIDGWRRDFADRRRRREPTKDDLAMAAPDHYEAELRTHHSEVLSRPTREMIQAAVRQAAANLAALWDSDNEFARINALADLALLEASPGLAADRRQRRLARLTSDLGKADTVLIEPAVDAFIAEKGLLIAPEGAEYRNLALEMMRAEIEALKIAAQRDKGDYTGQPADPVVKRPTGNAAAAVLGESVTALFEQYVKENPKGIATATLAQARRDIGTFVDLVGADFPAAGIDKKAVREWKKLLQQYPVKASETGAFRGMSFKQIIKANETVKKPVIVPRTVNRYMGGFGAFCNWLAAHDYIAANPFTKMYLAVDKSGADKVFTAGQLNVLFASPLFQGCMDNDNWDVAGDHKVRDHRFWLPLLIMYSGARPGEMAQLLVDDVREEHGQWIMHITEAGDSTKHVKTAGSVRVLPIHPELVRIGFVRFHNKMKAKGEKRMFPEAKRNSAGQIAAAFESKFGKYLTKLGIKAGRGLSLYSFRHGFADAMRRAGYMNDEFGFLLGHSKASMTDVYGHLPQGTLAKRVTMIEAVGYPGMTLLSEA